MTELVKQRGFWDCPACAGKGWQYEYACPTCGKRIVIDARWKGDVSELFSCGHVGLWAVQNIVACEKCKGRGVVGM